MGSPIDPPVHDFETVGDACFCCIYSFSAIFRPGMVPKYIEFMIDGICGAGIGPILINVTDTKFRCEWRLAIGAFRWLLYFDCPANLTVYRKWKVVNGDVHRSFDFVAGPPCLTRVHNLEAGEHKAGDFATMCWGPGIDEAAYLAQ